MAENKKFSVRTDGTGQNVFVSDVFLLSVPEEERVKVLSINDDGRVVLTTVSGSGGGGTVDTGSLLNNASVSSNTITFTRGNATTFNLTVDTGSGGTTNTGSLITTSSVSLNTITFTKGDASTFDITVDTGSDEFTGTVTSVGGTGTVNGITLSGTVTTSGNLSLGGSVSINNSNWSGTDLSVANGGTGASTFTSNALLTGNGTSAIQSESNLTFNGSTLTVTGGITATIGTGTDNSVVVKNSSNQLVTDEIDPKVWAGNLVDKQGTPVQDQVAIFNDSDTILGSSNFTFNNSTLSVTGNVDASGPITGSNLMLDGTLADGAGETTVLVIDATGNVKSDEIDSRVWGSTLISGSLTANRIPYGSDANTIQDSTNLTYNGTTLTANAVSVTNDLTVGGNLTINGDLTYLNTTNTLVEDQFILLGSGSTANGDDKGIIFNGTGGTNGTGAAFFYDGDEDRLSYATTVSHTATAVTPTAYIPLVFDVTGASHTPVTDVGNIKIEAGEAYIYV